MLFIELLHSFGLCLMVFHILPKTDMARCLIHLSGIFVIPAFLKTLFVITDKSLSGIKRVTLTLINGIAFLIQFGNLAATCMFSIPLTDGEKQSLVNDVIDNTHVITTIQRQRPLFTNRIIWEVPMALIFVSLSFWENYAEGDLYICSFKIPLLDWKKNLLLVKQRLYILIGLWKIGWTLIFAVLLVPGLNFNMNFSDLNSVAVNHTKNNSTDLLPLAEKKIDAPTIGITTSPLVSGIDDFSQINLTKAIKDQGIKSVLHLTEEMLDREQKVTGKNQNITNMKKNNTSNDYRYISEVIRLNFEKYGVLYLNIISNCLMAYFGSLACKLCMQLLGFTVPMFLATPITFGLIIAQCNDRLIPSYIYVWVCPESKGDIRLFHLLWLGAIWISQIITTSHIWFPRNGRMAKVDRYEYHEIMQGSFCKYM